MKTLSIKQPYASLIVLGLKRLETRSWFTPYRGVLHIHASKEPDFSAALIPGIPEALEAHGYYNIASLPTGHVIGRCVLAACYSHDDLQADADLARILTPFERIAGAHGPGRFAWWLTDAQPLLEPFPASGRLGIWECKPPWRDHDYQSAPVLARS